MSLSIINTMDLALEANEEGRWNGVGDLVKKWVAYAMSTQQSNIEFKEACYIQRISYDQKDGFGYDYMGSSEFEYGIVGKSVAQMIAWHEKGELVLFQSEDGQLEGLCHVSLVNQVEEQIREMFAAETSGTLRLQERLISHKFDNFLSCDNAYFFSKSGNALDYLKDIEQVAVKNNHTYKIQAHPKYKRMQQCIEEFKIYCKKKEVRNPYPIYIDSRRIHRNTFESGVLSDDDFEGTIIIPKGTSDIVSGFGYTETDLLNAMSGHGRMFSTKYWTDQGDFVKGSVSKEPRVRDLILDRLGSTINGEEQYFGKSVDKQYIEENGWIILSNMFLNESCDRKAISQIFSSDFFEYMTKCDIEGTIYRCIMLIKMNVHTSQKHIDKVLSICPEEHLGDLEAAITLRRKKIEAIGKKTVEDIKRVYTTGEYIPSITGELDKGFDFPTQDINFSNNLARMGFKAKELNVYVDPKTYKKAYNEILIWNPDHGGASVEVGPSNYDGIKGCLNMEELTGVKMISNCNIAATNDITDFTFSINGSGGTIQEIIEDIQELKSIDLRKLFWLFSRVRDIESRQETIFGSEWIMKIVKEIGVEEIQRMREIDISETVYNDLMKHHPGEMTSDEYRAFAISLNTGLRQQLSILNKFIESHRGLLEVEEA